MRLRVSMGKIIITEYCRPIDSDYVARLCEVGLEEIANWPAPIARELPTGQYQILEGQHRITALDMLGYQDVELEIVQADSDLDEILIGIAANVRHGKPFTKQERNDLIVKLHERYNLSFAEIGKIFLCARSTVQSAYESATKFKKLPANPTDEEIQTLLVRNFIKNCVKIVNHFDSFEGLCEVVDEQCDMHERIAVEEILKALNIFISNTISNET